MTKDEIIALVTKRLSGQGNQVDLSNTLPVVISAVLDLIPETDTPRSLIWDITSMGEISEEVTIPADVMALYNGQVVLKTKLNTQTVNCTLQGATSEYLIFSDDVSVSLWVYYNGKIKPADHD